jgi:TolB-like protein/class 3 adenylate cyclase
MREQRKLAAVLAADVVGYSRLMGRDEAGTLARLKEHRAERLEPALSRYGGRLVKLTGDGILAEFPSAVDAVGAALQFQRSVDDANAALPEEQRIVFRVGLHIGDLIVDGDDLYGDGVNVAARLEGEAAPGGIVVSGALHEAVAGKLQAEFVDLGRLALKNIDRQVQAYRIEWRGGLPQTAPASLATAPLALPDKPSIAVLPFQNMSGDPEQEYFADGVVEDIITALSRFNSLFVIARNSSFTYKGRAVDIKQVGRDLGVRYVLEGSVRKAAGRVRITGQLIEVATGAHLWADRFDRALEDIFDLQDQVTAKVVAAVAPRVTDAEIELVRRKPPGSLTAYDLYLKGSALFEKRTLQAHQEARALFEQAIARDPAFSSPYAMLVRCHSTAKLHGWPRDQAQAEQEVRRLAAIVSELGNDDALALSSTGFGLAWVCRDYDRAAAFVDRALSVNPNLVHAWMNRAMVSSFAGDQPAAMAHFTRARRISPIGPDYYLVQGYLAYCHLLLGEIDEAIRCGTDAVTHQPHWVAGHVVTTAALALKGDLEAARRGLLHVLHLSPGLTASGVDATWSYRAAEDRAKLVEGLKLAGLPP